MGVPVITMVGKTAVGRAGFNFLQNLGLPELIATTPEQFVQSAVHLFGDLGRLAQLRLSLREQLQKSPLMNARRFAHNLETSFRGMWQEWCDESGLKKTD